MSFQVATRKSFEPVTASPSVTPPLKLPFSNSRGVPNFPPAKGTIQVLYPAQVKESLLLPASDTYTRTVSPVSNTLNRGMAAFSTGSSTFSEHAESKRQT